MSLTKHDFGQMLLARLETTTDVVALTRWANQMYADNSRGLEPGLKDVLRDLGRMEDAPEFEYSVGELLDIAKRMIAGDK
ncbi:hypothetical protein WAE61_10550 [Comamonadaceae bacterium PP-2]